MVDPNINHTDVVDFRRELYQPNVEAAIDAELIEDTVAWDLSTPTHPTGTCRVCDWLRWVQ